jgi:hypothetical protein
MRMSEGQEGEEREKGEEREERVQAEERRRCIAQHPLESIAMFIIPGGGKTMISAQLACKDDDISTARL